MKKQIFLLAGFLFIIFPCFTNAATISSKSTGGAWKESSTWEGNTVPTKDDDVIITSTVTVNGGSYSTSNYYAKSVTIKTGGIILREQVGGLSNLNISGNLTNNGEITDNADWFDIKVSGNFENNGVCKPRSLTMNGSNAQISANYKIECKTLNFNPEDNVITAKSNLHFNNCELRSNNSNDNFLNIGNYTLTLSADEVSFDSYYNKFSSKCISRIKLKSESSGKIILNKAILSNSFDGDLTLESTDYGLLANFIVKGGLTINNGSKILSERSLNKLNIDGAFNNYGRFCTDTVLVGDKQVAPLSFSINAMNNVTNPGIIGKSVTTRLITNGNNLSINGNYNGNLEFTQSLESDKPGGKVVIDSELNLYGELDVYADLEITQSGYLKIHHSGFGPLYVRNTEAQITNNGTLIYNHFVNDSWNYNTFEDPANATFVNVYLRDWDSRIENINIEVHNNQTYPGLPASAKRWWRVTPEGTGKVTGYYAKFYYDESLLNGQKEENLKVYQSTDEGETWNVISVGEYCEIDTENNCITVGRWDKSESYLTEFGDFVISAGDGSVPIESNIKIDMVGRDDIRIGAPNPWTIHVYNVTDRETEPVLVGVNVTEDIRFKEALLPFGDSLVVIPVDSMGNTDDLTQVFFIPFLAPNEHISFDVIVYGLPKSTKNANDEVPTITAGGLSSDFVKGKVEEYLIEEFINKKLELCEQDGEAEAYRKAMNLTVDQYKIKKQTYSAPVEAFRHVAKDFGTKVIEAFPGGKIITTVGNAVEKVASIKDNLRRRIFNWFYKEIGLIKDKDLQVKSGKQVKGKMVNSWDPNKIVGPTGYGEKNFMAEIPTMHYTIFFENKKEATAPAYRVQIVDTLSAAFNIESVKFGQTSHSGSGYNWKMERNGNILKWDIEGIELPPNTNPPEGEGWVKFSVELNENVKHGDAIENGATIIFDMNEAITTNTWVNTLDFEAPETQMQTMAETTGDSLVTISCIADDKNGSGINNIKFFVSKNGAMFEEIGVSTDNKVLYNIADTVANNFRFYAISTDNVGNTEKNVPSIVTVNTFPTSTRTIESLQNVTVYPNPTSGELIINWDIHQSFNYEIFGLSGKLLLSGQEQFVEYTKVDLHRFNPGAYFLKITNDEGDSKTFKVILKR